MGGRHRPLTGRTEETVPAGDGEWVQAGAIADEIVQRAMGPNVISLAAVARARRFAAPYGKQAVEDYMAKIGEAGSAVEGE